MYGYLKGFIVSLTLVLSMLLTPFALVVSAEAVGGGGQSVGELAGVRVYGGYRYGRPSGGRYYYYGRPGYSYRYRHDYPRRYHYYGYPRYRYRYYHYRDPYYYHGEPRYYRGPNAGIYFSW